MTKLTDIKTGDILAWKGDRISFATNLLIKFVRVVTRADYGHVGVAVRFMNWVFVLEASFPVVKLALINPEEEIYHIPMDLNPTDDTINWLFSLIGLKYGILNAIRAGLGLISLDNNTWQCAEIVLEFLKQNNIILPNDYTPDDVIKGILISQQRTISLLTK